MYKKFSKRFIIMAVMVVFAACLFASLPTFNEKKDAEPIAVEAAGTDYFNVRLVYNVDSPSVTNGQAYDGSNWITIFGKRIAVTYAQTKGTYTVDASGTVPYSSLVSSSCSNVEAYFFGFGSGGWRAIVYVLVKPVGASEYTYYGYINTIAIVRQADYDSGVTSTTTYIQNIQMNSSTVIGASNSCYGEVINDISYPKFLPDFKTAFEKGAGTINLYKNYTFETEGEIQIEKKKYNIYLNGNTLEFSKPGGFWVWGEGSQLYIDGTNGGKIKGVTRPLGGLTKITLNGGTYESTDTTEETILVGDELTLQNGATVKGYIDAAKKTTIIDSTVSCSHHAPISVGANAELRLINSTVTSTSDYGVILYWSTAYISGNTTITGAVSSLYDRAIDFGRSAVYANSKEDGTGDKFTGTSLINISYLNSPAIDQKLFLALDSSSAQYFGYVNKPNEHYYLRYDNGAAFLDNQIKIQYNANGGSAAGSEAYFAPGTITMASSASAGTRTGYTFSGWSRDSGATTATYVANSAQEFTTNQTFYAVWTQIPATAPTISSATGNSVTYGYSGKTIQVSASAASGHTLSYQWYTCSVTGTNKVAVANATSNTYTVPNGLASTNYYYICDVTAKRSDNNATATTSSVVLTFVVAKSARTFDITLNNWNAGATANSPSVTSNPENGQVTYTYYTNSACTTMTTSASGASSNGARPSLPGTYYVKAVIAATDNYLEGTKTKDFAISLRMPTTMTITGTHPLTIEGTQYDNLYYLGNEVGGYGVSFTGSFDITGFRFVSSDESIIIIDNQGNILPVNIGVATITCYSAVYDYMVANNITINQSDMSKLVRTTKVFVGFDPDNYTLIVPSFYKEVTQYSGSDVYVNWICSLNSAQTIYEVSLYDKNDTLINKKKCNGRNQDFF